MEIFVEMTIFVFQIENLIIMKTPYWLKQLSWLKAFASPFKRPKIKFYIGKIALGTPYFLPRKWVKFTDKDAYNKAVEETQNENLIHYGKNPLDLIASYKGYSRPVPKKVGFDFVSLGWKTKWDNYRHEWNPIWSFVFFKWQIAIMFIPENDCHYWESWLYYENDTDKTKTKEERIIECMEKAPQMWSRWNTDSGKKITIDYYTLILKKEYIVQL